MNSRNDSAAASSTSNDVKVRCAVLSPVRTKESIWESSVFVRFFDRYCFTMAQSANSVPAAIQGAWPYGIEMRNDIWLGPEFLACLARHRVAHVYNSWTDMPTVSEQLALPGSRANPGLVAARFLLTPGKTYERTIQDFEPFDSLKKTDENARSAAATIIDEGARTPSRYTYVFVNNRLEGCAPRTIQALVQRSAAPVAAGTPA